jgi:aerobic carbon-monoxide dehydrogenase small subunit
VRGVKTLSLAINGRDVRAEIEPRLSLADFLREHEYLTGTHIGCEHGVCGACTVLIDGAPARSCITWAVACDGARVTTIEGLEDDAVMAALREKFSEHHALQCGYCTPGMLVTARDILLRLPDADEGRIRLELAGNLCRCTGYVGIVAAIQSALAEGVPPASADVAGARAGARLGPVGSHAPATLPRKSDDRASNTTGVRTPTCAPSVGHALFKAADWARVDRDGVALRQSFVVPFARAAVWHFFSDLDQVARCMPGARLTRPLQDGVAEGEIKVKLGPIVGAFSGSLEVERDENDFAGVVRGAGRDANSASSARAIIAYRVDALEQTTSRVDVSVKFLLSGALAQFSRAGLVKDVADHITHSFARNLAARLAGPAGRDVGTDGPVEILDAGAVARQALWARTRAFFRRMLGRP